MGVVAPGEKKVSSPGVLYIAHTGLTSLTTEVLDPTISVHPPGKKSTLAPGLSVHHIL